MNTFQLEKKEIKSERDDFRYSSVYLHKRTAWYISYEEKLCFIERENMCDVVSSVSLYL